MKFQGFQRSITDILLNNAVLKFISLSAAIGIWVWVQNTKSVEITTRANLSYTLPQNLAKVKEPRQNISITLVGPQGVMKAIDEANIYANLDLSDSKAGENVIDIAVADLQNIPKGVKLLRVSPPSVEVSLDEPMTKEVKIKPNLVGKVSDGWKIVKISTEPETVTISGAQSLVNQTTEVLTGAINIRNLRANRVVTVEAPIPQSSLKIEQPRPIKVSLEVEPELSTRDFDDIPIVIRKKGWRVMPSKVSVKLRGTKGDLGEIKSEELTILLSIPKSIQNNKKIEINYKPENKIFKIVHGGGGTVSPVQMSPSKITLHKIEPTNFFEKWK